MSVEVPERIDPGALFPGESEYRGLLDRRTRRARLFQVVCLTMLMVAVLALGTLLYTIVNESFGLVAVVNERSPESVVAELGHDPAAVSLADLTKEDLVTALANSVSRGAGRRLEREQRFFADRLVFEPQDSWDELCASAEATAGCTGAARDQANVYALVLERVVVTDVIASNNLIPSLLRPAEFEQQITARVEAGQLGGHAIEDVDFQWRAWFNVDFLRSPSSATPETAGIRTAVLGSAWLVAITLSFAVPVGVGAAIYLVEFAKPNRINSFIQTNIYNLAGVPSIIYGMLGLAILVRALSPLTSGAVFADGVAPSENGRTILSAGITLGLLTLPVVIISAQEALLAVPNSLRQAGMALGATRFQTVRSQILPVAMPGIMTGTILAVARAVGETAPLLLVGAAGFITADPTGPFSKFTALPIQIFQWTSFPQEEFRNIAAAASLALLLLLLTLNATAVILRNRFARKV